MLRRRSRRARSPIGTRWLRRWRTRPSFANIADISPTQHFVQSIDAWDMMSILEHKLRNLQFHSLHHKQGKHHDALVRRRQHEQKKEEGDFYRRLRRKQLVIGPILRRTRVPGRGLEARHHLQWLLKSLQDFKALGSHLRRGRQWMGPHKIQILPHHLQ